MCKYVPIYVYMLIGSVLKIKLSLSFEYGNKLFLRNTAKYCAFLKPFLSLKCFSPTGFKINYILLTNKLISYKTNGIYIYTILIYIYT